MFYKYDKETLQFKKVNWISLGAKLLTIIVVSSLVVGWTVTQNKKIIVKLKLCLSWQNRISLVRKSLNQKYGS